MRYRPPGVTPLEIWNVPIGTGILSDLVGTREFGAALRDTFARLHTGDLHPFCRRGFETVALAGGGASEELADSLSTAPFKVACLGPDPFIAERGGYHILDASDGAVVDVGQTQVKISMAGLRFTYARDFETLPVRPANEADRFDRRTTEMQRSRLEKFISRSLRDACRQIGGTPEALVMALPCELSDDTVPGSSSYIGTEGNGDLVPNVLRQAGLNGCRATLLNDAELAAVSVALSPVANAADRILVVTVGFGVGAALLDTRPWKN